MENMTISINGRIRELMDNKKVSINEMAEKLGMNQSNLSRMLRNDDIKVSTVVRIAKILEVPISTFFEELDKDLPPAPQKIDAIYERLTEVWQAVVKQGNANISVAQ